MVVAVVVVVVVVVGRVVDDVVEAAGVTGVVPEPAAVGVGLLELGAVVVVALVVVVAPVLPHALSG